MAQVWRGSGSARARRGDRLAEAPLLQHAHNLRALGGARLCSSLARGATRRSSTATRAPRGRGCARVVPATRRAAGTSPPLRLRILRPPRLTSRRSCAFVDGPSRGSPSGAPPPPAGRSHARTRPSCSSSAESGSVAALASLRVWVDFISIPQRNRSEQRLSIASLPTFASLFRCANQI